MLWDIIRDWFVQYVWGGVTSTGNYFYGLVGSVSNSDGSGVSLVSTDGYLLPVKGFVDVDYTGDISFISMGDWLSTTSTIIVLLLLSAFLFLVVRYMFRLCSGLFRGR